MAVPKKAETVESKPANKPDLPKLFEKLGAPLYNAELSRGAMHADGTIYLVAEKDGLVCNLNEQPSPSLSERLMHIQRLRAGHPCVLVIGGQLFAGGDLLEEGGEVRVEVGDPIPKEI